MTSRLLAAALLLAVTLLPRPAVAACVPGPTRLCLLDRFAVEATWTAPGGTPSAARALPSPGVDGGAFWFFSPDNPEVAVKMVDGSAVNGFFWFFHGGLTDLAHEIAVTDTVSGALRRHHVPAGRLASGADIAALPGTSEDLHAFAAVDLVADFTHSPAKPQAGQTVSFSDASTGEPDSWCWFFNVVEGEETPSTCDSESQNATHVYASPGTYEVRLQVSRTDGPSVTVDEDISSVTVDGDDPVPCTFEVTATRTSFGANGGDGVVHVEASAQDCPWTAKAESKPPFLTVDRMSGTGDDSVPFSVEANETAEERSGMLVVAGKTFTIEQLGKVDPDLVADFSFSPEQPGTGQTITFSDSSTGNPELWCWSFGDGTTLECSADNSTVTHAYDSAGDFNVRLEVRRGELSASRNKTVIVSDGTCLLQVSPTLVTVPAAGGVASIAVTGDAGCPWDAVIPDAPGGFLQIPSGGGTGDGRVEICVAANRGAARTGTVRVADQEVAIEQDSAGEVAETCQPDATTLCLQDGRIEVRAAFRDPAGGGGTARTLGLTPQSGYFTFYSPANLELLIKVLDGRPVNGHFWLFQGALSDITYAVTATDTATGDFLLICNPAGTLRSRADFASLPAEPE